jgi:hypothetical protein
MKYPCVESTLDVADGFRVVRLWYDMKGIIPDSLWEFSHQEIIRIKQMMREIPNNKNLLERLCEIPGLNAVQLLIRTEENVSHGVVVYLVPFDDVHG